MTGELDDLARLWTEPLDDDVQVHIEVAASKARSRAKWLRLSDTALLLVLVVAVASTLLWRPGMAGMVTGAAILLALAVYWKRSRRWSDLSLAIDPGSRARFVETSLSAKTSELHRSTVTLILFLPVWLATTAFAFLVRSQERTPEALIAFVKGLLASRRAPVALVLLAALLAFLLLQHVRLKREQRVLLQLRATDRAEDKEVRSLLKRNSPPLS